MKNTLLIIGASGHGKVIADIASKMNLWKNIAFLDDDDSKNTCLGYKVIGNIEYAYTCKEDVDFFVAIGKNSMREEIQERLIFEGQSIAKLIHPSVIVGTDVEIGEGTAIMAGVVINSSTIIGKGCIINTNSNLDHDNILGDYIHISPGVQTAGGVIIGKNTWLGIGTIVSNNINICKSSVIGAGTLVLKDVTSPGTYVGNPLKKIN